MTDISAIGPKELRSLTLCTAVLGYTMQNLKVCDQMYFYFLHYSETSDSGPSEKGTLY